MFEEQECKRPPDLSVNLPSDFAQGLSRSEAVFSSDAVGVL